MINNKSPLRYPGGKSRGAEKIFKYVMKETKEMKETLMEMAKSVMQNLRFITTLNKTLPT